MSEGIKFDEEQSYGRPRSIVSTKKSLLIRWVLSTHIVSTDKGAQYVLLGIVVVAIIFAFVFPSLINGSQAIVPQSVLNATTPYNRR